ncbi:MAG: hypothetical protein RL380_1419 [Verrucomicrobiota bacterium]
MTPRVRLIFAGLVMLLIAPVVARAQKISGLAPGVFSRSGQFVIYGVAPGTPRPYQPNATNRTLVRLDANLLTVSCERIKSALLTRLALNDQWRGKIHIALHPAQSAADPINIGSETFGGGWQFELTVPDLVEPERFVRALTQTLLAELASRNETTRPAPLPAWLAEGLPRLLLTESEIELVLNSQSADAGQNVFGQNSARRLTDTTTTARELLAGHKPLPLARLGQWPDAADAEANQIFQASALLFLNELLALKNSGPALVAALPELTADPDWRVGLTRNFRAHFKRIVDLEKWWALQSAYISVRTPAQTWSPLEALDKLNLALRCPLEVQLTTNDAALRTDAALQTVIRSWEFPRQEELFRAKLKTLEAIRVRSPKPTAPLVQQYHQVLETYLKKMGGGGTDPSKLNPAFGRFHTGKPLKTSGVPDPELAAVKDALLQLDVLDKRRDAWRANLTATETTSAP